MACVLEENYCFDAEIYADELDLTNPFEFREDQRSKQMFSWLGLVLISHISKPWQMDIALPVQRAHRRGNQAR